MFNLRTAARWPRAFPGGIPLRQDQRRKL